MKFKNLILQLKELSHTTKGKNIVTFCIFLLISTIFWLMMTLNEPIQRDYKLNVEISGMPTDVTLLTLPPKTIDVSVSDKGRALLKFDLGETPTLSLDFSDFSQPSDSRITISDKRLANIIRERFGSGAQILSCKPDSISLLYTTNPGVKLPVIVDIDAQAAPQYIIYGGTHISHDSVLVYSATGIPPTMISVRTHPVSLRNLSDTTHIKAQLVAPAGMRLIPDEVEIIVPVEPLVAKKSTLEIVTKNVPNGYTLLTFPVNVDISYLLPMSVYASDFYKPKAVVDFNSISSASTTVGVSVIDAPEYYKSLSVNPATVEYVIEH